MSRIILRLNGQPLTFLYVSIRLLLPQDGEESWSSIIWLMLSGSWVMTYLTGECALPWWQRRKQRSGQTVNREVGVGSGKRGNKHTKKREMVQLSWERVKSDSLRGLWLNSFTDREVWRGEGGKGEVRRISQFSLWTTSSPLHISITPPPLFSSLLFSCLICQPVSQHVKLL